ncbi:MAG: threonine synthase [Gemmatimonadaceae bacterium]
MTPSVQRCATCSAIFPETDPRPRCGECDGLLELEHPSVHATAPEWRALFEQRSPLHRGAWSSGVWRYQELILPTATTIVSQPEGNTPLIQRAAVSAWAGHGGLQLKHEGHNPTGSFKDRGMTVAMTQALRIGATTVACASTGNTSAALAAYAALAGLRALVFVPAGAVTAGKLAQAQAYGATTLVVRGDFDRCLALAQEASAELGIYLVNSINPFRLEGQKTIVFEMLQQLAWDPPEWIVLPAGNLGNTSAFGKALREALALGLITRVPRLAAVQAEGASPFAQSFRTGFRERVTQRATTVASAIRIGDPASYERAVRAIRETEGIVTSVTDDEIMDAKAVIDGAGVGCEPASAASVAGVRQLARTGTIQPGDRVVALLTGHVLKDTAILTEDSARAEHRARILEIEPQTAAVARALAGR